MHNYPYPLSGFVTILALLVYLVLSFNVGRARVRLDVPAPATTGPDEFLRYFRVQMNTLEQIVLFLPALWLVAGAVNDGLAAAIGILWPFGRVLYARGYYQDAKKRSNGFFIGLASSLLLLLIGGGAVITAFIRSFY